MPYIGRQLTQGNFIKLDDLQSQFNGTKTTFSLTAGGQTYKESDLVMHCWYH